MTQWWAVSKNWLWSLKLEASLQKWLKKKIMNGNACQTLWYDLTETLPNVCIKSGYVIWLKFCSMIHLWVSMCDDNRLPWTWTWCIFCFQYSATDILFAKLCHTCYTLHLHSNKQTVLQSPLQLWSFQTFHTDFQFCRLDISSQKTFEKRQQCIWMDKYFLVVSSLKNRVYTQWLVSSANSASYGLSFTQIHCQKSSAPFLKTCAWNLKHFSLCVSTIQDQDCKT